MDYLVKNLRYLSTHPDKTRGQYAAGEAAGITQSAVSKIITGATKEPSFRTVVKLARHYGVSLDALASQDMEALGITGASQPVGLDEANIAQAVELLYLLGDARPEDYRFHRLTWPMIKIAVKGIEKSEGDPRKAMAEILSELSKET